MYTVEIWCILMNEEQAHSLPHQICPYPSWLKFPINLNSE